MSGDSSDQKIQDSYRALSKEAQELVLRVLELEKEKLHMGRPHGIVDDLLTAVKEVVQ